MAEEKKDPENPWGLVWFVGGVLLAFGVLGWVRGAWTGGVVPEVIRSQPPLFGSHSTTTVNTTDSYQAPTYTPPTYTP